MRAAEGAASASDGAEAGAGASGAGAESGIGAVTQPLTTIARWRTRL